MSANIVVTTEADVNVVTTTEQLPVTVIESPAVESQVIVTAGAQGPAGKNGLDGTDVSAEADNQIKTNPDGLYVPPFSWTSKEW